ncbi:MAG: hypothetical protein AAFX50_08465, partial [Acidobacteriota bacterium]
LGLSALAFLLPGASAALLRRVVKGTGKVGDLSRIVKATGELSPAQRKALTGSDEALERFLKNGDASQLPASVRGAGEVGEASVRSGFKTPFGPRAAQVGGKAYHFMGIDAQTGQLILQRSGAQGFSLPVNRLPGAKIGDEVVFEGNKYLVESSRAGKYWVLRPNAGEMTIQRSLAAFGEAGIEVRLASRTNDEVFRVRQAADGSLFARQLDAAGRPAGAEFAVRAEDLVPRFVREQNMILGDVVLDAQAVKNGRIANQFDLRFADVKPAAGRVIDARRGLGSASVEAITNAGQSSLLDQVRVAVNAAQPGERLSINVLRFDSFDDAAGAVTSRGRAAQELIESTLDAAERGVKVDLVTNPTVPIQGRVLPETWARFERQIQAGNIRLQEFRGADAGLNVGEVFNHSKTFVFPERGKMLVSTNPVWIDKNKLDTTVTVTGDAVKMYTEYMDLLRAGTVNSRRYELVDGLRARGVLLNDPITASYNLPAGQFGLIHDATKSLDIMVSDLRDPKIAQLLVDKAKSGVDVKMTVRGLDPASREVLEQAIRQNPGLKLDVRLLETAPYYHGNFVAADGAEAVVGTSYFWRNQQDNLTTSSYEMGVVLSGENARTFLRQADEMKRITGPGDPLGR